MPLHVEHEEKLNVALLVLVGVSLISGFVTKWLPWLPTVILWSAVMCLLWILAICYWRLTNKRDEPRIYQRLTDADYWRIFGFFWVGYSRIAHSSESAFFLISLVAVPVFFLLVTIGIVDSALNKTLTPRAIGCAIFVWLLYGWQKSAFVEHHGVPIIGHFLEKPKFNAQYYVRVSNVNGGKEFTALADLRVENYTESEDYDDRTYTYDVRDIWVERLRFTNGAWMDVEDQFESLRMDEGTIVTDERGREWFVDMTKEKIN